MQVKCNYCDNYFEDTLEKCPYCSAPNEHIRRTANKLPKTIDELKEYCRVNNVPVDKMRFHIGENYKGAKAYGIYRDGDEVIVYKNKADGTRAVRYSGKDEAYAVNEIFQKMRAEFNEHKAANIERKASGGGGPKSGGPRKPRKRHPILEWMSNHLITTIIIAVFVLGLVVWLLEPAMGDYRKGYYNYNDQYYYSQGSSWYRYDENSGWEPTEVPGDDIDDYWESTYYDYDYDIQDFTDSYYYNDDGDDWSSDWDDDDDWSWSDDDYSSDDWDDSDWDWDSGSDWDSDW